MCVSACCCVVCVLSTWAATIIHARMWSAAEAMISLTGPTLKGIGYLEVVRCQYHLPLRSCKWAGPWKVAAHALSYCNAVQPNLAWSRGCVDCHVMHAPLPPSCGVGCVEMTVNIDVIHRGGGFAAVPRRMVVGLFCVWAVTCIFLPSTPVVCSMYRRHACSPPQPCVCLAAGPWK